MDSRSTKIRIASWIGIVSNAILALLKITIGIISGSIAVIADGVDSSLDVASNFLLLFTSNIADKKPDKKYPYGYQKAENLTSAAITFFILFAGAQLFYSNVRAIILEEPHKIPSALAVYVIIFSIVVKAILAFYQKLTGKKFKSQMLIVNAQNMKYDIFLSTFVLLGLVITLTLKVPVIDRIIAIILSIWIMRVAIKLFRETSVDLMDGVDDPEIYNKVLDAVHSVKGVYNPHRVRIRKMSYLYVVDLDIEVHGEMTVKESHELGKKVEQVIKNEVQDIYDVMLHIEPMGNIEKGERFGISGKKV